jgi:hypothetical protein
MGKENGDSDNKPMSLEALQAYINGTLEAVRAHTDSLPPSVLRDEVVECFQKAAEQLARSGVALKLLAERGEPTKFKKAYFGRGLADFERLRTEILGIPLGEDE